MKIIIKAGLIGLAAAALVAGVKLASTMENLQTAYNREMNVKALYGAFADKADKEGYPGAAGVFRAVAFSESVHAANHAKALEALGGKAVETVKVPPVKGTKANLEEALKAEINESSTIYPPFVKQAIKENNPQAVMSLKGAMASESSHARLFSKVMKKASQWKEKIKLLVCRNCGYTSEDLNIKFCPFCTHPREEFAEM